MAEPSQPPTWQDGDPLMEAIANAVYEQCETGDGGIVHDDPRNIAAAAAGAALAILGRDRCTHSKATHNAHHKPGPVHDCPWCTTSPTDQTTSGERA